MACHVAALRVEESIDEDPSPIAAAPPASDSAARRCASAGLRPRRLGPARIFDAFIFHSEVRGGARHGHQVRPAGSWWLV